MRDVCRLLCQSESVTMIRVTPCRDARSERPSPLNPRCCNFRSTTDAQTERPYKGLFIYRCETKLGLLDRSQGAHSIEHGEDGHAYVGEDRHPHGGYTKQRKE